MSIEWDEHKRKKTIAERGLDFADVSSVNLESALTVDDTRFAYSELRYITFAPINGRLCVFAWCHRNGNMRVFSLRKANKREIKKYVEERRIH